MPPFAPGFAQLRHENLTWRLAHVCRARAHEPRGVTEAAQFSVTDPYQPLAQLFQVNWLLGGKSDRSLMVAHAGYHEASRGRILPTMRYKLSVFAACWAIVLGLEYILGVPAVGLDSDPIGLRFLIAALMAAGATFFWVQLRSPRQTSPAATLEDSETMRTKVGLLLQLSGLMRAFGGNCSKKCATPRLSSVKKPFTWTCWCHGDSIKPILALTTKRTSLFRSETCKNCIPLGKN